MHGIRRTACSSFTALTLLGCSAATQAAFVPQLDVGMRSSRAQTAALALSEARGKQRWDLTVFARLAWTSRRSAALIPSRTELSPDAWIAPCPDRDCFWDHPEDEASPSAEQQP